MKDNAMTFKFDKQRAAWLTEQAKKMRRSKTSILEESLDDLKKRLEMEARGKKLIYLDEKFVEEAVTKLLKTMVVEL